MFNPEPTHSEHTDIGNAEEGGAHLLKTDDLRRGTSQGLRATTKVQIMTADRALA